MIMGAQTKPLVLFDTCLLDNCFQPVADWVEERTGITFNKLRGYCFFLALLIAGTGFLDYTKQFQPLFFLILTVFFVGYLVFILYPAAVGKMDIEDLITIDCRVSYFVHVNINRKKELPYRALFAAFTVTAILHHFTVKEEGDLFIPGFLALIWAGLYFKACLPSRNRKVIICDQREDVTSIGW
jgi:hypothetical protein